MGYSKPAQGDYRLLKTESGSVGTNSTVQVTIPTLGSAKFLVIDYRFKKTGGTDGSDRLYLQFNGDTTGANYNSLQLNSATWSLNTTVPSIVRSQFSTTGAKTVTGWVMLDLGKASGDAWDLLGQMVSPSGAGGIHYGIPLRWDDTGTSLTSFDFTTANGAAGDYEVTFYTIV